MACAGGRCTAGFTDVLRAELPPPSPLAVLPALGARRPHAPRGKGRGAQFVWGLGQLCHSLAGVRAGRGGGEGFMSGDSRGAGRGGPPLPRWASRPAPPPSPRACGPRGSGPRRSAGRLSGSPPGDSRAKRPEETSRGGRRLAGSGRRREGKGEGRAGSALSALQGDAATGRLRAVLGVRCRCGFYRGLA